MENMLVDDFVAQSAALSQDEKIERKQLLRRKNRVHIRKTTHQSVLNYRNE